MKKQNPNSPKNRKLWLNVFMLMSICFSLSSLSFAQHELDFLFPSRHNIGWLKYTDAPNAFYHHLSQDAFVLLKEREELVSTLSSLSDWQQRQKYVKERLQYLVGPFPEKTPLNPEVKSIIKRDGYRIEHIIIESRPKLFVTSSLYIPDGLKKSKAPVIIYCSGHSEAGYRSRGYQHIIVNLVKKGFIVFAFDPLGQGERLEYFHPETGQAYFPGFAAKPWVTHQHSYPGAQAFITGSSQINYMVWDGIRAVDYLVTRAEVDPIRIGITGGSGGGLQSAVIAALDERIHASAPERYITSYQRLFESIGPQDAEQIIYGAIKNGIDHADLLTVRAPLPTLMITTRNDFFSIQGARETFEETSTVYQLYGKPENFIMVEDSGDHTSTKANREAMYGFFQYHLNNPGSPLDLNVDIPTDQELKVTSTGQVLTALNSETVYSLTRKYANELFENLQESRKNKPAAHLASVINNAKTLSGYMEPEGSSEPIYAGQILRDGYRIERYIMKGEGDYPVPFLLMIPETPTGRALLYLHPEGKSAGASENGEIEWFVNNGYTVLAPDLIGTGETSGGIFRGDAYMDGVSYNMWFSTVLTGRSIVGIRAGDVTRLIQLLEKKGDFSDIYSLAHSEMTPVLLHAAAFNPSISGVALISPLSSYHSILTNRMYKTSLIHGAVANSHKTYDLQDLAASLAPRKLLIVNMSDATGSELESGALKSETAFIESKYIETKFPGNLQIEKGDDIYEYLSGWIEKE
jgi:pimeloyl-ACP methyl ester carboxylesterase